MRTFELDLLFICYCCFVRPLACPGSIDLKDLHGDIHRLEVKVLGTEETWNTPSLILATDTNCNGIAVFSQVNYFLSTNSSHFFVQDIKSC